jgi:hypothetical protein
MPLVNTNPTWHQFFGEINYPFAYSGTAYYLDYLPDDVNIPTFSFLNGMAAVSPGESQTKFTKPLERRNEPSVGKPLDTVRRRFFLGAAPLWYGCRRRGRFRGGVGWPGAEPAWTPGRR